MVDKYGVGQQNGGASGAGNSTNPYAPGQQANASNANSAGNTGNNAPRQANDPVGEPSSNAGMQDTSGYKPDNINAPDAPRQPGDLVTKQPDVGSSHQINGQPANEFYKDNYGDGWEKQFKNDHGFEPNETGSQEAFDKLGPDQNYQAGMENGNTGNIGGVENATDGMVDTVGETANAGVEGSVEITGEIGAEASGELGAEVASTAVEGAVEGAVAGAEVGMSVTSSVAGATAQAGVMQTAMTAVSNVVASAAQSLGITSAIGTQALAASMALGTAGILGGGGALIGSAIMNSNDVARYESVVCDPSKTEPSADVESSFSELEVDEMKLEVLGKIHSVVLAYGGDERMTGAIAGNFEVESVMDPTCLESLAHIEPYHIGPRKQAIIDRGYNIGNGLTQCGTGLGQWSTGTRAGTRGQELRDKAEELDMDLFSVELQLIYMFGFDHQWCRNTLAQMRDDTTSDTKELTWVFMKGWEGLNPVGGRYGTVNGWDPNLPKREEYAERYAMLAKEMEIDASYGESILSKASIDGTTVGSYQQELNQSDGCDGKIGDHGGGALPVLNFEGKSEAERIAILFNGGLPTTEAEAMTYVERFEVPILNTNGDEVMHKITLHKMLKQDTINIFTDIKNSGFRIYYAEGMCWRTIAGSSSRSWHSYGTTIDINPDDNGHEVGGWNMSRYNSGNSRSIMKGSATEKAFKDRHWFWGGDWRPGNRDYMHFNAAGSH